METFLSDVLPILVAILAVTVGMWLVARPLRLRLRSISVVLDGSDSLVSGWFAPKLRGQFHGQPSTIWLEMGTRTRSRRLVAVYECREILAFRVRARGFGSLINSLRFGRPVRVGVVYLDDAHVFFSPTPQRLVDWIARNGEARSALELLLRVRGITSLTVRGGTVRAEIDGYLDDQARPEAVAAMLRAIEDLTRSAEGA